MTNKELLLFNSLSGLHLLDKAPRHVIVRDLCGLQAQFSRNPEYSLLLRSSDYAPDTWDTGLVKIWAHRGTMHVVPEDELGLYLSAAGNSGSYQDSWWGLTAAQQERWAPFIAGQVRMGNDTRDGLKKACVNDGMDAETLSRAFHGWGGLIKEMCWRGELACATGTEKRYLVPKKPLIMDRDEARGILIRRYFQHFGPATLQDCRTFFGYKQTELAALFKSILPEIYSTTLEGNTYYHAKPLITDFEMPECVLLPGFDQLIMGYKDRGRFLNPAHMRKLITISGIVFPSIILCGEIRARWKLDGGHFLVSPFEKLTKKDEKNILKTAEKKFSKRIDTIEFADVIF